MMPPLLIFWIFKKLEGKEKQDEITSTDINSTIKYIDAFFIILLILSILFSVAILSITFKRS